MQGLTASRSCLGLLHTEEHHLEHLLTVGSPCARSARHKEMKECGAGVMGLGMAPLQKPVLEVTVTVRRAA